jgi:transcriptional regulator with XRE-family HTH domain
MTSIDELLGLDMNNVLHQLADELVSADRELLDQLVAARKKNGLSIEEVASRIGISPDSVREFENIGDYRASILRRYLLAIGARINYVLEEGIVPDEILRVPTQLT